MGVHQKPDTPRDGLTERSARAYQDAEISFTWSASKIRIAGLVLLGTAIPAAVGFALSPLIGQWLCLAWLAIVACLANGLSRRARSDAVVLSVDQRGILDRRLMSKPIAWNEIKGVCRTDTTRSHVVDIALRRPNVMLQQTRWSVRIGGLCQSGYGVPAITISTLLLECNVAQVLEAVARWRPDLLHQSNR
jgi:hypothetical protein